MVSTFEKAIQKLIIRARRSMHHTTVVGWGYEMRWKCRTSVGGIRRRDVRYAASKWSSDDQLPRTPLL